MVWVSDSGPHKHEREIVKLRKAKVRRLPCRHNMAHQLILGYSVQPQGI